MPRPIPKSVLDRAEKPEDRVAHSMRYHAAVAQSEHAGWRQGNKPGVGLGFVTLDDSVRLIPGELIIVNGPSSSGKTSFAVQVAMHVAEMNVHMNNAAQVLFFSAEMRGAELSHKMAGLRSDISVAAVRNNHVDDERNDEYAAALAYVATLPIHVTDMPFPTTDDMYEIIKTYLDNGVTVPLVCFDYLGIAGDEVERGAEHLRIKQIAARLKNLAKLCKVPVLAVGQTNRTINESKTKLPAPSTTAGTGHCRASAWSIFCDRCAEHYERLMPSALSTATSNPPTSLPARLGECSTWQSYSTLAWSAFTAKPTTTAI